MIALLLWACGPRLIDAPPGAPVALEARLEARRVGSGEDARLVVQVETDAGWSFAAPTPTLDGLTVDAEEPTESDAGDRLVTRFTYRLHGPDGSYVIPPLAVDFAGPQDEHQALQTAPLYLDIGVKGPTSEIEDIARAPEEPLPVWPVALVTAVISAIATRALLRRLTRKPPPPPAPPPDPAEVALAAWEAARSDVSLDEHALAQRLSSIFRAYLEAALEVPAESLTSFEVLDRLREHPRFTASLHDRAGRLLTATDLVKFARQGDRTLLDALDEDLRAVIAATRGGAGGV